MISNTLHDQVRIVHAGGRISLAPPEASVHQDFGPIWSDLARFAPSLLVWVARPRKRSGLCRLPTRREPERAGRPRHPLFEEAFGDRGENGCAESRIFVSVFLLHRLWTRCAVHAAIYSTNWEIV